MSRCWRLPSLLLVLLAGSSCTTTHPATQVMVVLDAQAGIAARADRVHVKVASGKKGAAQLQTGFDKDVVEGAISWPLEISLVPQGNDATRIFEFTATAFAGDAKIGEIRAIGGYIEGKSLALYLVFEDACEQLAGSCGDEQTCKSGRCADAHVDPKTLDPFDHDLAFDAGTSIAIDAGDFDATTSGADAAVDGGDAGDGVGRSDGGVEAGADAASDAGPVSSYLVGGTVSGLTGTVVLANNGGDELSLDDNGSFGFATAIKDGEAYSVTVKTQPSGQACTVKKATGKVDGEDVEDVAVTCVTGLYSLGGTVAGLAGGGLVLRNKGGDPLALVADGTFAFAQALSAGETYNVTVSTQPTSPNQTCVVSDGMATVSGAHVTDVSVICTTREYAVSATVTGLAGSGLQLKLGAEVLDVNANATYDFGGLVFDGAPFVVSVQTQPSTPSQTCVVMGNGQIDGGNAVVDVVCTTNTYEVGGTVTGLTGAGLELRLDGQVLSVAAAGSFAFATELDDGSAYVVEVETQPSSPSQTCTPSSNSGALAGVAVSEVLVSCTTNKYSVGGRVSGLASGSVTLEITGGETETVGGSSAFTFETLRTDGTAYTVTVKTQPTNYNCVVANGSDTLAGANVENVNVTCARTVGDLTVTVAGLGAGVSPTINVTGPGAYSHGITSTTTLTDLAPGAYTVTAQASVAYGFGSYDVVAATQNFSVLADATAEVTVTYNYACTTVVTFTDSTLETRVRAALSIPSATLTCADMAKLTTLTAGNGCCAMAAPANLSGLEYAVNLTTLNVAFTNVSNLSPLANLTGLTSLDLTKSQNITSLSSLSGLTKLATLNISALTGLTSLTPLTGLPLQDVNMNNADALDSADLAAFAGSTTLTNISLGTISGMTSLDGLADIPTLASIGFTYSPVSDISALATLPSLRDVQGYFAKVSDLAPLVANPAFGAGDNLGLARNCLTPTIAPDQTDIATLIARGAVVTVTENPWSNCP